MITIMTTISTAATIMGEFGFQPLRRRPVSAG
jgi:hypothetical protein